MYPGTHWKEFFERACEFLSAQTGYNEHKSGETLFFLARFSDEDTPR